MIDTLSRLTRGRPVILVAGDLMLDRYVWGEVERISPEAPVQVLRWERENEALGGAANVARNLAALGCQVRLLGFIGDDEEGRRFDRLANDAGIDTRFIQRLSGRPTISKTRFIGRSQHVLRVDKEESAALPPHSERVLLEALPKALAGAAGVVCSDYLKGVLSPAFMEGLVDAAKRQSVAIVIDTKGNNYIKYKGVNAITPNLLEVSYATGLAVDNEDAIDRAVRSLFDAVGPEWILVTRGPDGMTLFGREGRIAHETAKALDVYDVTGAGDTAAALFALALFQGLSPGEGARLANLGAGIVVAKVGTAVVTPAELEAALSSGGAAGKTFEADELALRLQHERAKGRKVVFTNGCFDLLHVGHIQYLQQARMLGDLLVVGLNSDASVHRIKGEGRPLIEERQRALLLGALACVDHVVFFEEDTPERLIRTLRPDILVKGGDYTSSEVVGKEIVESFGGRVEVLPFVEGVSTTNIVNTILERYGAVGGKP